MGGQEYLRGQRTEEQAEQVIKKSSYFLAIPLIIGSS
jgi:hypothetical protein